MAVAIGEILRSIFAYRMLTNEEIAFIEYWEANRLRRKRFFKQLAIGLPLGALLVGSIFISFISGWHKEAEKDLRSRPDQQPDAGAVVIVIVIAALLIVVFTAVFSARHKWDMYEQHYLELLAKKEQP